MKKCFMLFLLICLAFADLMPVMAMDKEDFSKPQVIESQLDIYLKQRKDTTASVSIALFRDGQVTFQKQSGYMDLENKIPVDQDSIYEWGSVSKTLIWVAIMQLVEEGKLDLNQSALTYLPKSFKSQLHLTYDFSLLDLMNHQAGFQESIYPIEYDSAKDIPPLKELLLKANPGQVYQPGTVTAYNNWSAALAAYIVENQSGQDFYSYVQKHIFAPLGMTKTSVKPNWSDNVFVQKGRQKGRSYAITTDGKESYGKSISYIGLYPAGSCAGTLDDFARYCSQFTAKNSPLFKKANTLEQFKKASLTYKHSNKGRVYHGLWRLDYGQTLIGHAGNTNGYSSAFWFQPQSNTGYCVMTNEVGETTYNYGLAELFYGAYQKPLQKSEEITGIYTPARTIETGFARFFKYTAGLLPIQKSKEANVYHVPIVNTKIKSLGKNIYQQDQNGLSVLLRYQPKEQIIENYTSDYFKLGKSELITAVISFLALGLNLIVLPIELVAGLFQKMRKKKSSQNFKLMVVAELAASLVTGIVLFLLAGTTYYNSWIGTGICCLSWTLVLIILTSLSLQFYNESKKWWKWLLLNSLAIISVVAIFFFQLYQL